MEIISFFIVLAVMFFVFLLCRELVCWYFKINERMDTEKAVLYQLRALNRYFDSIDQ